MSHEPVFKRSAWGTSRYVYNPGNPIGFALIIAAVLFAGGGMYYMYSSSRWSEGELRDAVYAVTEDLDGSYDGSPEGYESGYGGGYAERIRRELEATDGAPKTGLRVNGTSGDRYEVGTAHTDHLYCMHVARKDYLIRADVSDGAC
ncbi:hypothetical protein AB0B50_34890 [Streptomyces sp. NPDC041068]|uniref:hypothetical protein n=1 Tax=Streptomyces sp. NPDC041068 TaxID=3155130 RepID=UPI0033ED3AAE